MDIKTITEIQEKPVEKITAADRLLLCEYYRAERLKFEALDKAGKPIRGANKAKAEPKAGPEEPDDDPLNVKVFG